MIDHVSASALREHLQGDEKLIWAGKPGTGFKLRPADALLIPFSLLWGGFAIFWETSVIRTSAPWFFKLWGIPFVLVGIFLIAGRFIWDALVRRRQVYGVTNNRLLVLNQFPRFVLRSFDLTNLPSLTLVEWGRLEGSIRFAEPSTRTWGDGGWGQLMPSQNGTSFEFIQNPHRIYTTIVDAQRDARRELSKSADGA
ncbi:MAG: PH domain-containing protein [Hyphomicrobiales bacterium]